MWPRMLGEPDGVHNGLASAARSRRTRRTAIFQDAPTGAILIANDAVGVLFSSDEHTPATPQLPQASVSKHEAPQRGCRAVSGG